VAVLHGLEGDSRRGSGLVLLLAREILMQTKVCYIGMEDWFL